MTVSVEHTTQRRCCGCVDQTLSSFFSVFPLPEGINKSNDCDWINTPWSSTLKWDIGVNLPNTVKVSNTILCPRALFCNDGNFLSYKFLALFVARFGDDSKAFHSSNKSRLCFPVFSFKHDSVWRIDCRGNHFDLDLVFDRLWNVDFIINWGFREVMNNNGMLAAFLHTRM